MNDLIVKFLTDRRSWLAVILGTLVLILLLFLPTVDEYGELYSEKNEIVEQIASAEQTLQHLTSYESRFAEKSQSLAQARQGMLQAENEADFQNTMVKMVRESGCRLKSLNVAPPKVQPWCADGDPLASNAKSKQVVQDFELEKRQVNLILVGNLQQISKLLQQLTNDERRVHVQTMVLQPQDTQGQHIELQLELWYFSLRRISKASA